jgi:hypothetical protein
MQITRELLKQTHWQQANGKKIAITEMDDNHLKNSIRMIQRQLEIKDDEYRRYALALLNAEKAFRKRDKSQPKGQLSLDLPNAIEANVERPKSILRVGTVGQLPLEQGKLRKALDRIALKHGLTAEELWDTCDDPRDYGYDGDCW